MLSLNKWHFVGLVTLGVMTIWQYTRFVNTVREVSNTEKKIVEDLNVRWMRGVALTLGNASEVNKLLRVTPNLTIALCGGSIAPIAGYQIHVAPTCDEAYAMNATWVVNIIENEVGVIDVSEHLEDGYCGHGWGICEGGKRVECSALSPASTDSPHNYERIHQLLHSAAPSQCTNTHVLKGEKAKEPDVHICLDAIPTTGCVVYSIGIANNWIFDDFMVARGCHVFSFDPSMTGAKKHKRHVNHLFEPIGIGTNDGSHKGDSTLYGKKTNYEVETLGHIMERHGHTHLTMVRMDVESAEWDVLEQWVSKGWMKRMDQLLLEIHMWKPKDEERHSQILHDIPMELFHSERNQFDGSVLHGDMTRVYEMGWQKKFRRMRGVALTLGNASEVNKLLRVTPNLTIALCGGSIAPIAGYQIHVAPTCDEAYAMNATWVVNIIENEVGVIDVSEHLEDGYCGHGWGICEGGKRVECSALSPASTDSPHNYERIHQLLHSAAPSQCTNTHVLKGEKAKEPDVHICLDAIPTTGCVVYSIGIANNWIFDDFMVARGCHVFSFDPSMTGAKKHKRHVNHLFEPIGIGTNDGSHKGDSTLYGKKTNYEVETLGHIMERHGHTHLTMVRMDVESAEWDVLEQWVSKGWMKRMDQLLLEIHMWKPKDEERHSQILHDIPMELFHSERNQFDGSVLHGDMTRVYEMGWQKKVVPVR
eukprot:CAMPEP_0172328094 /NCGR_PEP_ID=MMETSP1058-20130122/60170_1 /TAXON_ID=83371 /ORGANISM="Detonula confervacea, Strain CCMP 353" /LENGTH=702 /DNA_ID=CAMNT_0013045191 /DNA_START=157 /DNA_END=2265 /DNA_ORIENTATION=-